MNRGCKYIRSEFCIPLFFNDGLITLLSSEILRFTDVMSNSDLKSHLRDIEFSCLPDTMHINSTQRVKAGLSSRPHVALVYVKDGRACYVLFRDDAFTVHSHQVLRLSILTLVFLFLTSLSYNQ